MAKYAGIDYMGTLTPDTCPDCGCDLPLSVRQSAAGYYLGRFCPRCGPYSRESGYYSQHSDALAAMPLAKQDFARAIAELGLSEAEWEWGPGQYTIIERWGLAWLY